MSPLYIAIKGKETNRFYRNEEWNEWKEGKDLSQYKIKYFKGLGGLGESEYERMITDPKYAVITRDSAAASSLDITFGNDSDKRKVWMSI